MIPDYEGHSNNFISTLVSDFDEILQRTEFHNVEKIKTIGSTFMAASGMNPYIRQGNTHKYQHIHELVEFVFELQRSVNEFNQSLIEFDLVLRYVKSRVWTPPPCPTGAPWGPHPHPPWGWGIDFEKPRGWGILTQTPWGFGGVFYAFLCFSNRKKVIFLFVFEKKKSFK